MKFVIFEVENGLWITTPELEADCRQEMEQAKVTEFDRKEVEAANSLLIECPSSPYEPPKHFTWLSVNSLTTTSIYE